VRSNLEKRLDLILVNETFYIGYLERAPRQLTKWLISVSAILLVISLGVGFLLVQSQDSFEESVFEFGTVERYAGWYSNRPVPMLTVASPNGDSQTTFLLVLEGKHGAASALENYDGKAVSFDGTKIYRGEFQMLEVRASSIVDMTGLPGAELAKPKYLGNTVLKGEIVDSKCYLGVMNPGEKTVHRACAALCIRGGIPPLLVLRDDDGIRTHLLLTGPIGEAINNQVLPFVARPVEITGQIVAHGNLLEMRVGPEAIRALR